MNSELKPKIRFKGFTDDWEQHKLGDIIIETVDNRGKNPPYYCETGIPVIDNFMIKNNGYPELYTATRYLDDYLFNNFVRKYNEYNDVLITLVGNGIGNIALFPKQKSAIIQNTLGMRFEEPKIFKYYELLSKNSEIVKLDRGMAQPSIRQDELKSINVKLPRIDEQLKIEKMMFNLDNLITHHQRKCDKLVELKRSLLEKMFPQNNSVIPEIRFRGFTDDWEQRRFEDWGTFYYGHSCPKWSVTENSTIPCIRYGELYTKFGEKINEVYSYTNINPDKLRFSKGTEVLIPRVGEDPMDYTHCTWLSLKDVAIGEMISVFNTNQNPLFSAIMFNATLQKEFAIRVEGSSVTNLYYEKLKDINIKYPKTVEQEKISCLFDSLDNLITLHQRKHDKLNKIKQSLLNDMFV